MAPLYDLRPHEKAVAPAAESVTGESEDRVRDEPTRMVSRGSWKPMGSLSMIWTYWRAIVWLAGPNPSLMRKMTFLRDLVEANVYVTRYLHDRECH